MKEVFICGDATFNIVRDNIHKTYILAYFDDQLNRRTLAIAQLGSEAQPCLSLVIANLYNWGLV